MCRCHLAKLPAPLIFPLQIKPPSTHPRPRPCLPPRAVPLPPPCLASQFSSRRRRPPLTWARGERFDPGTARWGRNFGARGREQRPGAPAAPLFVAHCSASILARKGMGTGEEPPARLENGGRRRRWMDGDDDDDEEYVAEEEEDEDFAEELSASSAGEEGKDSDAEYQEDEEEEEEEETPHPKRPVKGGARGGKGKTDPATRRAERRRYDVDDDYEEDPSEEEEDPDEEEYLEDTPRPNRTAKASAIGGKGKMDPATARHRYEVDDDYEEEPDDEESDEEEVEEYKEETEEDEEPPPRPKSVAKSAGHDQDTEPARSHRQKYEEDMDFEPELDEEEEEVDEDTDFDPEVDDEDEDEFEDEDEEEFSAARARKVAIKNPAKRKPRSKRRSQKKKKVSKRTKASKRKTGSVKSKKRAPVKRVRKRFVVDDSDEDSEHDDDFIVDDLIEEDQHPRKKARTGTSKQTDLECPSALEEGTWPNVESETSEFEFVTSEDEPDDAETADIEASTVRKGRNNRKSGSESSSDFEFILSDKELENLEETEPPKVQPVPPTLIRKNSITKHGEDKGKKKEEPEAGKPICGICLSEEQRATVQGVLNCCSHYFCFACIMEWSKVESRCPLCKQRFTTITKSSKADLGLGLRKSIIKVEERDQVYQPTEEEIRRWLDPYENVVCIECNQGGDDSLMLLCDICDSSAHTYCVGLGREVPEGNWYCGGCRLNDEGPSHARIPHTPGYERQNYRNHVDFNFVGFGVAAQNGTGDRSSSINCRCSFQGIDLNLSPREVPGEIYPAGSQVSTDSVSTPSGRSATVSGRREIHRHIRIFLSRPRPVTTARIEDICPSYLPHNGAVPRTELNHHSFRSSSEANTSQIHDSIQNQRNGPFAPLCL